MIEVKLASEDILNGVIVGARRMYDSVRRNLDNQGSGSNWHQNIEGALAELAFAKHFGLWFDQGVGKYKSKDVGDYHIRSTKLKNGCLILRKEDPNGKYVLVVGEYDTFKIIGWIHSEDCMKDDYLKSPNDRDAAWFVPQSKLHKFG